MTWSFQKPFVRFSGEVGVFESFDNLIAQTADETALEFLLNVNGGNAFQAFKVHDALKGRVNLTIISGCAVSAGYILATTADRIAMARGSHITIHAPTVSVYGSRARLLLAVDSLDDLIDRCVKTVSTRRRIKSKAVEPWYRDGQEHVFDAETALRFGLIDEIIEPLPVRKLVFPELVTMADDDDARVIDDGKASLLLELLRAIGPIRTANAEQLRRELFLWQHSNIQGTK